MGIADLMLKNGSASIRDFYPLTSVITEDDKEQLREAGYNPGFTVSEWPYRIPVERVFYGRDLFPATYYYNADAETLPIVLNLNIYGDTRMKVVEDEEEFCTFILDWAEKLRNPDKSTLNSYLFGMDNNYRSEVFQAYLEKHEPSPELYDMFISYYTLTDYGASSYKAETLKKVFAGKSEKQKENTIAALANLPEEIVVYRGEAEGSTPYNDAFSWTIDINVAYFFSCRLGNRCRIISAKVSKENIIEYITDRDEQEVIILPEYVKDVKIENLYDIDSSGVDVSSFIGEYQLGREIIRSVYRKRKNQSDEHGMIHSARVLFLSYIIRQLGKIELTRSENSQLFDAIIYHDSGRKNDDEDDKHGLYSRKVYSKAHHDAVVEFLIEYHCLPDKEAEEYLKNHLQNTRAGLLYRIMKDADALDRVRFGLRDLDVNYLRFAISKKIVPIAMQALHGIKM